MMSFLVIGFGLSDQFQALLETISPSTIDRKLKREKERFRLKGMYTTKPGSLPAGTRKSMRKRLIHRMDEAGERLLKLSVILFTLAYGKVS